jgi:hypothetical protein
MTSCLLSDEIRYKVQQNLALPSGSLYHGNNLRLKHCVANRILVWTELAKHLRNLNHEIVKKLLPFGLTGEAMKKIVTIIKALMFTDMLDQNVIHSISKDKWSMFQGQDKSLGIVVDILIKNSVSFKRVMCPELCPIYHQVLSNVLGLDHVKELKITKRISLGLSSVGSTTSPSPLLSPQFESDKSPVSDSRPHSAQGQDHHEVQTVFEAELKFDSDHKFLRHCARWFSDAKNVPEIPSSIFPNYVTVPAWTQIEEGDFTALLNLLMSIQITIRLGLSSQNYENIKEEVKFLRVIKLTPLNHCWYEMFHYPRTLFQSSDGSDLGSGSGSGSASSQKWVELLVLVDEKEYHISVTKTIGRWLQDNCTPVD